ncbi:MAG: type II toxin-antitoxin system YafQ family toxin [Muribaculaceae bacterium]|nr:type II toxin-antitoxin system YafQ family toxin [Muribaculaceae bacterium]
MYKVVRTSRFKKAFKRCIKRNLNIKAFEEVLGILTSTGTLPEKYKPHKLSSKFNYAWECHIEPDWLLIWEQKDDTLTLILIDTGSHSDIFG